jgi:hypothetical protein
VDHQAFAQLLGNYGEFIGAIAVVATLIYLAIQIRRNTQAMRATTTQALADSINSSNLLIAGDARLARLYRIGKFEEWDSLNEDEQFCWSYLASAVCHSLEAVLMHHRLNQADVQTVELAKEQIRRLFSSRSYQRWWEEGHGQVQFTVDFKNFVEQECLGR